jgi:WD40 repeat protein
VREAATGKTVSRFSDAPLWHLVWSPDSRSLAAVGDQLLVLDARTGKVVFTLLPQTVQLGAAWSPDGQTLATGSSDGRPRLWQAETGRLLRTFDRILAEHGHNPAWSPDGKRLAVGTNQTIFIFDTDSDKVRQSWPAHPNVIFQVAWSPDGKRLASCGDDQTPRTWESDTGKLLHVLKPADRAAAGGRRPHRRRPPGDADAGRVRAEVRLAQRPRQGPPPAREIGGEPRR